jgi:predicted HicB family RNase H-like nuclease
VGTSKPLINKALEHLPTSTTYLEDTKERKNYQEPTMKMSEEGLTAIIGIRVYPWLKKQMVEEAKEKGKTLSEYLHELIAIGWESINDED